MQRRPLIASFISKLLRPCPCLLKLLPFPLRRRFPLHLFCHRTAAKASTVEMDRLEELNSISERYPQGHFPPLLTPGDVTGGEVEEACRSFERYLVEMIVEEGNVRDLMDVEELLYCWNSLKSPVFVELVSSFYGELCRDLFSPEEELKEVDDFNVFIDILLN
ncbi:hypothetical protein AXF42_Ash004630 [Apostasia shenzhenica]|uniref:OVATE domain-containing protein n=1 Tax=Apostasia shenzhenica TaxID=1088818 RepID=A0A2I0BH64_9ASPA|nr:hypothetical protein AXF42_Ash004630 [Apostasia shenzhenica]